MGHSPAAKYVRILIRIGVERTTLGMTGPRSSVPRASPAIEYRCIVRFDRDKIIALIIDNRTHQVYRKLKLKEAKKNMRDAVHNIAMDDELANPNIIIEIPMPQRNNS